MEMTLPIPLGASYVISTPVPALGAEYVPERNLPTPTTSSAERGVVVPIPTFPLPNTLKSVAFVDEATAKREVSGDESVGVETESFENGDVVPMPTSPSIVIKIVEVPAAESVPLKYASCPTVPMRVEASPRDEVAVRVYPPSAFPTSMFPYDGSVERPVPPYATESVDDAETAPLIPWSIPVSDPRVRPFVPDTVRAVVEAYGKVEAIDVDVAVK